MVHTMEKESIVNNITKQNGWFVIKVEIEQSRIAKLGLTPSVIYRRLSNSKRSINPLIPNNRDFWNKFIVGGYYLSLFTEDGNFQMYFFIYPKIESDREFVRKNLLFRLKSIVLTNIQIGGMEIIPVKLLSFITTKSGEDLLQPFGKMFGNKSSNKSVGNAIELS